MDAQACGYRGSEALSRRKPTGISFRRPERGSFGDRVGSPRRAVRPHPATSHQEAPMLITAAPTPSDVVPKGHPVSAALPPVVAVPHPPGAAVRLTLIATIAFLTLVDLFAAQ